MLNKHWLDTGEIPDIATAEVLGEELANFQRSLMWWIGDLARFSERKWPGTYTQVWPEWVSPGMIARARAVAEAYPRREDRQHDCTWTQYMQQSGYGDRQKRLADTADKGLTTDELRVADRTNGRSKRRMIIAIDMNWLVCTHFFSGADVETAMQVVNLIDRLYGRLKLPVNRGGSGFTDIVCCFDSVENHRKALTQNWDKPYKNRPSKDPTLITQIQLARSLAEKRFACAEHPGMEADDLMASIANQFPGRVTLYCGDKDLRQALSPTTNILLGVDWVEDESTQSHVPIYKWYTATPTPRLKKLRDELLKAQLKEDANLAAKIETQIGREPRNLLDDYGVEPSQWAELQAIAGDPVDTIGGVSGIGEKGAINLIRKYGTLADVIQAARDGDEFITAKKRAALIEFANTTMDTTLKLVTMRTDLPIPEATRLP